jgi:hypothetical protein
MQELVMTIILTFVSIILFLIKKYLFKKKHSAEVKDFEMYQKVVVELSKLQQYMNADRVYILEFHNGTEYSLSHPVWKVSCLYEVVKNGIQTVKPERSHIFSTSVTEWLSILFSKSKVYQDGVIHTDCSECGQCDVFANVIGFNIDECDQDDRIVVMAQLQGVKGCIHAPIIRDGLIKGVLGLDFLDNTQWQHIMTSLDNTKCRIRECAAVISLITENK